jgi:hypothetical protein
MGSYEDTILVLEAELAAVEQVFAGLSDDEWRLPTKLVPVDPDLPHWTVFELAGHFDISISLTRMLIAGRDTSQSAQWPCVKEVSDLRCSDEQGKRDAHRDLHHKIAPYRPLRQRHWPAGPGPDQFLHQSAVGDRAGRLRLRLQNGAGQNARRHAGRAA